MADSQKKHSTNTPPFLVLVHHVYALRLGHLAVSRSRDAGAVLPQPGAYVGLG